MDQQKAAFLREGEFTLLEKLSPATAPAWGKMNAQQMVEHVSAFFKVSTEKIKFPLVTPEEHLPRYREFLLSDKPFRENTKAPADVLPDDPLPLHYPDLPAAIEKLNQEVEHFFKLFQSNGSLRTLHPVFGSLNFEEWVLLHYKHVQHHLRQFGLI